MKCRICQSKVDFLFKALVLEKHNVFYYRCPNCEFIQTENPHWLEDAYNNAITDLDVGLVRRNLEYSKIIDGIIKHSFDYKGKFLDYAGGYGLFVRLMRDRGFNFYRKDKYCENIFAKNYDIEDLVDKDNFELELVTAFEVFEHLENPLEEIEKILEYADSLIFSTELQPNKEIRNSDDWWYFVPEIGQHIAFYSKKTLEYIARKLELNYFSSGNIHIFSKKVFEKNPLLVDDAYKNDIKMESLINFDFNFSKNVLVRSQKIKKEMGSSDESSKENLLIRKISLLGIQLDLVKKELDLARKDLDLTNADLNSTKKELVLTAKTLERMCASREWKVAVLLRKIFSTLIPKTSLRRKIVVASWRGVNLFIRSCLKVTQLLKNYIDKRKPKPKEKRKINLNSKKLVYIGHSYHNKTKSTEFLIEYLKEKFDVKVVLDESWLGKPAPDLSFIDESYLGVVFFQLLPPDNMLKKIKNNNIIYFPMYDQSGRLGLDFWMKYRNLKIANFSKTLHLKLKKWGFESMYIQYFPEVKEFVPGKKDEAFFWQRLTHVNFNIIKKVFGDLKVRIHLHKAIDPDQKFIQPNKEDEKKYQVSYSDWFETRKEMLEVIKGKAIYVAPREYEGIGMSFLEAMAMGKAVVAIDNPTMNEYIENGRNGYLFDLKNPAVLNFDNLEEVQKNTHAFMKKGRENWEKEKSRIIDFIKKS